MSDKLLTNDLNNCPVCSGKAYLIEYLYRESPDCGGERIPEFDEFYVTCKVCGFVPNQWGNSGWEKRGGAIEAWQKITKPKKDLAKARKLLKEQKRFIVSIKDTFTDCIHEEGLKPDYEGVNKRIDKLLTKLKNFEDDV